MKINYQATLTPHQKFLYKKAIARNKFDKIPLKDGRIVLIDDFKINGVVLSVDGDNLIPLGAGDYELKDGRKFTIVDGGIISVISKSKFAVSFKSTVKNDFFSIKKTKDARVKRLSESLNKLKK